MHETDYIATNPTKLENKKLKFVKLLQGPQLPSALTVLIWRLDFGRPEHKKEMKNASEDLK